MTVRYTVILAILCIFTAGCAQSASDQVQGKVEGAKDKVKETSQNVWSGTVKTIDKAKGVEQTLMDSAADQRRRLEKEGQ